MKEESILQNQTKEILSDDLYKEVQEYYRITRANRKNKYSSREESLHIRKRFFEKMERICYLSRNQKGYPVIKL